MCVLCAFVGHDLKKNSDFFGFKMTKCLIKFYVKKPSEVLILTNSINKDILSEQNNTLNNFLKRFENSNNALDFIRPIINSANKNYLKITPPGQTTESIFEFPVSGLLPTFIVLRRSLSPLANIKFTINLMIE